MPADAPFLNESTWRCFWHPVCTVAELRAAAADGDRPLAVTLLGEALAIAQIGNGVSAFRNRCIHRSTELSVGRIEPEGLRCAYHGWLYGADGMCREIPSMPDRPIPADCRVEAYDAAVEYDLVWVRLDPSIDTPIPGCPAWDDDAFRCVQGEPYTWPTSAARRLENFVDLAHFPFVHDGSLGDRRQTIVPIAEIRRVNRELRFRFEPSPEMQLPDVGHGAHRLPAVGAVHGQSGIFLLRRRAQPALDDRLPDRIRGLPEFLVHLPDRGSRRTRPAPSRLSGSRAKRGPAGDRSAEPARDPIPFGGIFRPYRQGLHCVSKVAQGVVGIRGGGPGRAGPVPCVGEHRARPVP